MPIEISNRILLVSFICALAIHFAYFVYKVVKKKTAEKKLPHPQVYSDIFDRMKENTIWGDAAFYYHLQRAELVGYDPDFKSEDGYFGNLYKSKVIDNYLRNSNDSFDVRRIYDPLGYPALVFKSNIGIITIYRDNQSILIVDDSFGTDFLCNRTDVIAQLLQRRADTVKKSKLKLPSIKDVLEYYNGVSMDRLI